ncbi:hypothetical protein Q4508_04705 [Amphritea sp. 2_MG-2023]|uniref:hypothetical protein n=1 Tax=Amphritea TaxID=515417 RepID=UPI001C076720|nr:MULTISPECIES: hypothetical protein [Amphritea]MBU2964523.1 hypothetical protein [Amphritea atlantica]MDO6417851.1 hypothetical protein [Amphritea sp. 2_MG-2023]
MEITKTFVHTFKDSIRTKLRQFMRRSLYRYAFGVALITFAAHGMDAEMGALEIALRGLIYLTIACAGILVVYVISSYVQSKNRVPITIRFSEVGLVVSQGVDSVNHDWCWIQSAEESSNLLTLVIRELPRYELYLSKPECPDKEYKVLREWLVLHGKLLN